MANEIEILLINSNAKEQDIFAFALNNLQVSYTCYFAKDGKSAMKILSRIIPAYVFVSSENTNRFTVLKQIKRTCSLNPPSMIVYAENDDDGFKKKALHSGACMCIHKTRVIAELIGTLKSIFAQPVTTANAFHS